MILYVRLLEFQTGVGYNCKTWGGAPCAFIRKGCASVPLKSIVGQPLAVRCLSALCAQDRMPHALLFHGPDGVGKRTTALALAQAVNCPSRDGGDACGVCPVCDRIGRGIDVDVRIFEPARNEFLREQAVAMRDEAFMSPNQARRKFLILDAAHRITPEAANLLLKVLEEPPDTTVFVLLTDNIQRILSTISSRSMHVPFRPLSLEESGAVLRDKVDPEALPLLYAVAGGNLGMILRLSTESEMEALYDDISSFLDRITAPGKSYSPALGADVLASLAERINMGTEEDTPASRRRKGMVAVLETMLSLMEMKLTERVRKTKGPSPAALCEIMENIMDTIKIIEGAGHQVLALETLSLNLAGAAGAPAKG